MTCLFWGQVVELVRKMVSSETDACPRHSFTCASRWWAQSYSVPVFQKGNFFDHRQVVPAGDGGQPMAMPRRRVRWTILARHTARGYLPGLKRTSRSTQGPCTRYFSMLLKAELEPFRTSAERAFSRTPPTRSAEWSYCLVFRARGQQMVRADDAGTKTPIQKSRLLFCKPPKWTA